MPNAWDVPVEFSSQGLFSDRRIWRGKMPVLRRSLSPRPGRLASLAFQSNEPRKYDYLTLNTVNFAEMTKMYRSMCPGVSIAENAEITPIKSNPVAKLLDLRLNSQKDDRAEVSVVSLGNCEIGFQSYFVTYIR